MRANTELRLMSGQALRVAETIEYIGDLMSQRPEYLIPLTEVTGAGHGHEVHLRQGGIYMLRDLRPKADK